MPHITRYRYQWHRVRKWRFCPATANTIIRCFRQKGEGAGGRYVEKLSIVAIGDWRLAVAGNFSANLGSIV